MLKQYSGTTKGHTLPTAESALAHMRECDATSLIIVSPGKDPHSTHESAIKSLSDLANHLSRYEAHLSATSRLVFIWTLRHDSMRLEFEYRSLNTIQAGLQINEGTATFTYGHQPYRPARMTSIIIPHNRLRHPDDVTDKYGKLALVPQRQAS